MSKTVVAAAGALVLIVAVVALGYVFVIADDDDGGGDASAVQVTAVNISNEVDSNGQPSNPRVALPAGSRAVRASVRLSGAAVGMKVTGTWFQLGTTDSGAEGSEVSTSEVVLGNEQVTPEGQAFVAFSLGTSSGSLPSDVWLLRVYVNDRLVKTSGFVIGGTGATAPTTAPPPGATPAGTRTP